MTRALILAVLLTPFAAGAPDDVFKIARHIPFADGGGIRVASDLDGDGDADLVKFVSDTLFEDRDYTEMEVWRNDGGLRFTQVDSILFDLPDGNVDASLRQPLVGDVTGDTIPDLVVDILSNSAQRASAVEVYPGFGDGTFDAPIVFGGDFVLTFDLGQIDADPELEIVVVHQDGVQDNRLAWWDFNGTTFVSSTPLLVNNGYAFHSVTALDVNDDGLADAVGAIGFPPDRVDFFPTVAGAPTQGASFPMPAPMHNVNMDIDAGDVDDDGLDDLLVVVRDAFEDETYFLPIRQIAAGTFAALPDQTLVDPFFPFYFGRDPWLVDWDGDGDLDVAHGGQSLILLENVGSMTFAYRSDEYAGGSGQAFAGPVDLDQDGFVDFVDQRNVVLGRGDYTIYQSASPNPASQPPVLQIGDWEGDGDLDRLVERLGVMVNDGAGNFEYSGSLLLGLPGAARYDTANPTGFADFNGDGRHDLVMPVTYLNNFLNMQLAAQNPQGFWESDRKAMDPGILVNSDAGRPWPAGDLDGDGDNDLAVPNGYWRNGGLGRFDQFEPRYTGRPIALSDFNGTTRLDVVTVDAGQLVVWSNLGPVFTPQTLGPVAADSVGEALDVDGDLDPDLVVASLATGELHVVENLGTSFGSPVVLPASGILGNDLSVFDVDGDGLTDVVGSRNTGLNVVIHAQIRTAGPGLNFDGVKEWAMRGAAEKIFDLDGDGDQDVLARFNVENFEFDGTLAGVIQQYGDGAAGTGGVIPVLGVEGPLRPGHTMKIRLARGLGGTPGMLLVGMDSASIPLGNKPTLLVAPPFLRNYPIATSGAPTDIGAGEASLATPIVPAISGAHVYCQAFLFDALGLGGLSASNGVEIEIGF